MYVVFSQTRNFTVTAFTGANMYATSMAQRKSYKRQFRIEGSHSLAPACVIVAVRLSRSARRTQRDQAISMSVRRASTKDCSSGNETRTQNARASVPMRIVSYSYAVIVPCTVLYDVPINVL